MFVHELANTAPASHMAIVGDATVTYGELRELIRLYRNTLYEMGVRKGAKVGLYSANRAEFLYA